MFVAQQRGIGLVEIMVALLLLAVAVLGFSAMQLTAIKATDESLLRGNAMSIMRGGAEMMRANPSGIPAFTTAINGSGTSVTSDSAAITKDSCVPDATIGPTTCTINQLATRDALMIKDYASHNDVKIAVVTCPGTGGTTGQPLSCFIASWATTEPTIGDTDTDCVTTTGTYNKKASCFVMEAY